MDLASNIAFFNKTENYFYIGILALIDYLIIRYIIMRGFRECLALIRFRMNSHSVNGKVIDHYTMEDGKAHTQYAAIVEFVAADRHTYTIRSRDFRAEKPVKGTLVRVYYPKNEPGSGEMNINSMIALRVVVVIFFTAVMVLFNVSFIRKLAIS